MMWEMITYVQRKPIFKPALESYLNISERKNHFSNAGPVKTLLEEAIELLIGSPSDKRVLCVANGTAALHALIFYYNHLHGRELKWVSPSFTFPSCVVNNVNTKLADIDPVTKTLRPEDVGDADGIIITNLFGCIMDFDISSFRDKIVIYDNASSFLSCDRNGVNMCLKGDASFGSLHHTKSLGFGEGGFVVVNADMYDDMQAICGFGFKTKHKVHDVNASNFKMSDVSAAYILQHIDGYKIERHRKLQDVYRNRLPGVEIFNYDPDAFYGNMPIIFKGKIDVTPFREAGIEANKYYLPLVDDHVNSKNLYDRIINFPLHNGLVENDIKYICNEIKKNY